MRWPSAVRSELVALALSLLVAFGGWAPPAQAAAGAFSGTALWISRVPGGATPAQLAQDARADGARELYVGAGDGSTPDPQFTPALVSGLRAAGVSVCAWTFVYGVHPAAEAAVALAAVHDGAGCLVVDAEGQYDGRYSAAQSFIRTVRAGVGPSFPVGLAGQAEISQHGTFPYSVFLGPGGFSFDLPQLYWRDLGLSPDQAFSASVGANAIYGRPIVPVGQLYGSPSTTAVARFRSLTAAYGFPGLSFFSLDAAQPAGLAALRAPAPRIARRAIVLPTISPGADGDEIVWAQELLNAAGARLPVGGFYGAQTADAVTAFQTRHRLPADGLLDPATWRALMRFSPQEPRWAGRPPPQSAGG